MIAIINESEEIIPYKTGRQFEVIPEDKGYGLYLDNDIIEEYGSEELAVKAMAKVVEKIENDVDYIEMKQVHKELEV